MAKEKRVDLMQESKRAMPSGVTQDKAQSMSMVAGGFGPTKITKKKTKR